MTGPAMDEGCVFCRIAARQLPAELLHVSDRIVAFRDADPKAPTHVLIIPREHIVSLSDIGDRHAGMLVELMAVARHLARAEGIDKSGWRLVTNSGPDAGQSVYHLHFHLLGGRPMGWPPG